MMWLVVMTEVMVESRIVVMIIKWPPGLTDYFFLVLLASAARLFKCRRFCLFFSCVCAKMRSWSQTFLAKTMETALQGHGFKSCWGPELFSGFLRNCINCVHSCEDHSSFEFISVVLIWFISYTSILGCSLNL